MLKSHLRTLCRFWEANRATVSSTEALEAACQEHLGQPSQQGILRLTAVKEGLKQLAHGEVALAMFSPSHVSAVCICNEGCIA